MNNQSPFREAIERMEEPEIIDRLKRGVFSEEARPVAEEILRGRGVDPENPVLASDFSENQATRKPKKSKVVPGMAALLVSTLAGAKIGASFLGGIGAALGAAVTFPLGWWLGSLLTRQLARVSSKPARVALAVFTLLVLAFMAALVGVLFDIRYRHAR